MAENPTFQAPSFDEVAAYPAKCRAEFLAATRPHHVEPMHKINKILDAYNLWLVTFGS